VIGDVVFLLFILINFEVRSEQWSTEGEDVFVGVASDEVAEAVLPVDGFNNLFVWRFRRRSSTFDEQRNHDHVRWLQVGITHREVLEGD